MMQISNSSSTPRELKRKATAASNEPSHLAEKNLRLNPASSGATGSSILEATIDSLPSDSLPVNEASESGIDLTSSRRIPKRFVAKTIPRDKEPPSVVPHNKKYVFFVYCAYRVCSFSYHLSYFHFSS